MVSGESQAHTTPAPAHGAATSPPEGRPESTGTDAARRGRRRSIAEFLTDGSLPGLCAELTRLTGVGVWLLDEHGREVVKTEGGRGWTLRKRDRPEGSQLVPITLGGEAIAMLAVEPGQPELAAGARGVLERAVALLGLSATESVEHEEQLRHKIRELSALYRISSLLARAASVDRILSVALDSALDVLDLDAGSIVLLRDREELAEESERDIIQKVSRNLSRDWLESPLPLSKNRLFDRLALQGQTVTVENLALDERVLIPDRAAAEGLVSFINAGLVFHGQPIGIARLYGRTSRRFTDSERKLLLSVADQAALAVEQARLLKLEEEERQIQRQVALAADVQRRMMPTIMPRLPGLDVAAKYVPSFELGGDFFDFIDLDGHFGMVVGDVVGKGIAAALLMSAVRATLRAHVQDLYDLDQVISRVNVAMCRDTRDHEFVTLWYGVIDPATLRLTYCSAGHEPTLLLRPGAGGHADAFDLSVGGLVVGIDASTSYQRGVVHLQPGDVLIAYTDGVVDAQSYQGKKFGRARLRQAALAALRDSPGISAADVQERILWELRQHSGLHTKRDDQTLVVVRVDRSGVRS